MTQLHSSPRSARNHAVRLVPVMHIQTGETVTLIAETDTRFEERAAFGPAALSAECSDVATPTPADWLATHIENVAHQAHNRASERPVIVSAPMAALLHEDTAMACDAAIRRTRLCPQEICIEVTDAELSSNYSVAQRKIEALRKCGFRVSLDATKSCGAPLNSAMRLLLDNIRIDARKLPLEPELGDRIEAAKACGMSVIAENVAWRDGDDFADMGIEFAIRPKTDA